MTRFSQSFRPALLAIALTVAGAAQAHNAWVLPNTTVLSKPDWVSVDAAISNSLFLANHAAMRLAGLTVTAPDGSTVKPENSTQLKNRSVFDLNLTQPGTYRIATVNSGLFASYKDAKGQPKRWRGTPEKFAAEVPADAQELKVTQAVGRIETFVTLGKPSAIAATGQGLELLPTPGHHPNDLVAGEAATFKLQIDGKPAAGLELEITRGGTRYRNAQEEIKVTTDAEGKFSVTWPEAGMYWLETGTEDNKTSVAQAKNRRLSYVVTLEVLPQ